MIGARTIALRMGVVFVGACSVYAGETPNEGETAGRDDSGLRNKRDAGAGDNHDAPSAGDAGPRDGAPRVVTTARHRLDAATRRGR